jgi:pyridoxal/pyridoxine/pyridoxamine kinase
MLFKTSSVILLSKYVLPNMVRARLPSPIRIKSWIVLREVTGKYPTTYDIATGHKLNSNQSKSGGDTPSGDGDIISPLHVKYLHQKSQKLTLSLIKAEVSEVVEMVEIRRSYSFITMAIIYLTLSHVNSNSSHQAKILPFSYSFFMTLFAH